MAVHYPAPTYDYRIITSWYKLLKNESQCPTCHINGVDLQSPIEYHHLDRTTKKDTISTMVYCRAPLQLVMNETFKCVPLCKIHHVDYHRHERDEQFVNEWFDFKNKDYKAAIADFHAMAWLFAHPIMQKKYLDYMEVKNEICTRQDKCLATPHLPYRDMLRERA